MKGKRLLTLSLLLFVAASVASLVYQERRRGASEGRRAEPAAVQEAAPAAPGGPLPEEEKKAVAPAPAVAVPKPAPAAPSAPSPVPTPAADRKVVVYYLHTTTRCASCYRIENWAEATVLEDFAPEMGAGLLQWKVLNVEEPGNEHFVEDYQLFTKSVVLSEVKNGREVRWKRLDRVWDLLGDQTAFRLYLDREIRQFLDAS